MYRHQQQQQQSFSPTGHPVSYRQGASLGEGFFPHFVGGIDGPKSFLFSPYPAIPPYVVRTLHSGRVDDREHITSTNVSSLEHDTWSRTTFHTRWWDSSYSPTENIVSTNVSSVEDDAWSRTTFIEGCHVDANMTHLGRPFNFWRESLYEKQNSCGSDVGHDDANMTRLVKCVRIIRRYTQVL